MKNFILILIACLSFKTALATQNDTLVIKVSPSINSKNLIVRYTFPYSTTEEINDFEGYPRCEKFKIGYTVIDKFQFWYSSYKSGKRDSKKFLSEINAYDIDTNTLSKKSIRSSVPIFSGLTGSKKIVIVDANNNNDFSDDLSYEFDTLTTEKRYKGDTLELAPLIRVKYESFVSNKVTDKYTYIRLKPYDIAYSYPTEIQRQLTVYTVPFVHREGIFNAGGVDFQVSLINSSKTHIDNYTRFYIKIKQAGQEYDYTQEAPLTNGETSVVNGHIFKILSCNKDGSILKLLYEGYSKNMEGGFVANSIPLLTGKTLTGYNLHINKIAKSGSYVLLDFWGSWCGPCIHSIPLLKRLFTQLDTTKVQLIGVDYEYNLEGQRKARELLNSHKIDWPQIAELSTNLSTNSISKSLSVKNYPTFLLINPEGKIVIREIGEDRLLMVIDKLKELGISRDVQK
ncbi:TlpA family protein disulfide reductase [Spirosoma soli]|uniref:TlpA family protein disulfide reductase n=1 Tax=Spirosoma soli TaxID=1770529 RepID=A0ABW5M8C8_9BACT